MPEQPAGERVGNCREVALGYSPAMARAEAARCLACKNPGCVAGCPVGIDIEIMDTHEFFSPLSSPAYSLERKHAEETR